MPREMIYELAFKRPFTGETIRFKVLPNGSMVVTIDDKKEFTLESCETFTVYGLLDIMEKIGQLEGVSHA